MVKSLEVFFFKDTTSAFTGEFFFFKSYSILAIRLQRIVKKALFPLFNFRVYIDHLLITSSLKKNCLGKKS